MKAGWRIEEVDQLQRRDILRGWMGLGLASLCGCATPPATEPVPETLRQTVGFRESVAGMIAVVVDKRGARMTSHGSSGVPDLALDGDTILEIGSITKVLTALLLTEMAMRGEVGLDDPVARFLPRSATLAVRGRPITLLDLATHASGLPRMPGNMPPGWSARQNPLADYTTEMLYASLPGIVLQYEPGAHYEYSNFAFGLLGAVLALHAGKSYEELLIDRVCNPLGLADTRITLAPAMQKRAAQGRNLDGQRTPLNDMPGLQGAGAVRSTAKDLVRFLEACMGRRKTPLDNALARLLGNQRPTPLAGTTAALGWFVSLSADDEIAWKSGVTGGFNTCVAYSTRTRRGAIVLANFLSRSKKEQPVDAGPISLCMQLINPEFTPGDLSALYRS